MLETQQVSWEEWHPGSTTFSRQLYLPWHCSLQYLMTVHSGWVSSSWSLCLLITLFLPCILWPTLKDLDTLAACPYLLWVYKPFISARNCSTSVFILCQGASPFCKTRVGPRTSCLFFAVKIQREFLRFYCHGFRGSENHIVFLFFIHFPLYSSLPSLYHSHPTLCSEQQENLFVLFLEKAVSFISLIYGILSSYVFIFLIFVNILLNFSSVARGRVVTNFYNKFYLVSLNLIYFS